MGFLSFDIIIETKSTHHQKYYFERETTQWIMCYYFVFVMNLTSLNNLQSRSGAKKLS